MSKEPLITINGVQLSEGQACATRVAVSVWQAADEEGLNQDLAKLYDERLEEVEEIMLQEPGAVAAPSTEHIVELIQRCFSCDEKTAHGLHKLLEFLRGQLYSKPDPAPPPDLIICAGRDKSLLRELVAAQAERVRLQKIADAELALHQAIEEWGDELGPEHELVAQKRFELKVALGLEGALKGSTQHDAFPWLRGYATALASMVRYSGGANAEDVMRSDGVTMSDLRNAGAAKFDIDAIQRYMDKRRG